MRISTPVRPKALRFGLGDTGAVNCADFFTWPPNIFNPTCYGVTWAKLFGTPQEKAAAYGVTSPDVMYPQIPMPSPPPAPTGDIVTVPPASADQANQTIQDLVAQQQQENQQQNLNYFGQVASSLDTLQATTGGSQWLWLLGGAAVVGLFLLVPRRGR